MTAAPARRISVRMISAAAYAVASLAARGTPGASLLPQMDNLRLISATVGVAVAQAAAADGLADVPVTDPIQQVYQAMWRPEYPDFEII